jgi:type II secretory ATPase GspE/PulE/Tfp pilus assembly ATPase PilB-like protein
MLYSAVDRICTGRQKILTVEDPVEYELPGINQIPVNPKVGLTFASALRALVRQDPDVMLVGEIRDSETAEIATQAALTGHLVLSTLHTNDAPGAITRLVDLGVPEYLVAGVVEAVLAQRLVRRLCLECRHRVPAPPAFARTIGTPDLEHVWEGRGCSACRNTGFHGRTGIYEFLPMTPAIRDLVGRNPPLSELRQAARAEGMTTLREDGSRHVVEGTTTHGEILRVTV